MAQSRHLAALLGPSLIAITLTESINADIFTNTSAHLVYLNGALLFVAGLAIVRSHNHWTAQWPVLITLMGWVCLFVGLVRMTAPVSALQAAQYPMAVQALTVLLFVIGTILTFYAYRREDTRRE
ncbi:MAG TPA: hypothetical protein VFX56_01620 [Nitrospira sp.]|nr:hypothetical protein [Nitrospira sp.]